MRLRLAFPVALLAGFSTAAGADAVRPQATYRWVTPAAPRFSDSIASAPGFSNIIYLNRCAAGCTLHPGDDNSTSDVSSIPNQTSVVQAFSAGDAVWNQVVDCVRQTYAPFNVQVVTDRPAAGTNYHMAIVAGRPADVQMPSNVGGVSPFDCDYIPNSISFTFANVYGGDIQQMCWTVAQETAHSWGLDHKFDNRDPMTYLGNGPAHKAFQNEPGSCGEYSARGCMCTYPDTGKAQMNSFSRVLATFGSAVPDTEPPAVQITSPTNGAQVPGVLQVTANATDNNLITKVELRIDGSLIGSATKSPYVWSTATPLGQGEHGVKATAYDLMGNTAEARITVQNGASCKKPSDCPDGDTCVDGRCVLSGGDHGLGSPCTGNTDCASNQCGQDASGARYCVEACEPTKHGCPGGFGCLATGADGGVCWPGADDGGGGCTTGGSGSGVALFGLGVMSAMIAFRRRR
jgi:hypothetical protein